MISFFNRIGTSWVAKIIFFLLGVSMLAFWGLGGISNTSSVDTTAIKVGDTSVSMNEIIDTFNKERNKMLKITGGNFSPKQALAAGLLEQVVQQLVVREINHHIQEKVGLTASDNAVRKYVEKNPVFSDNLGHFDTQLFYSYLSQLGMTQAELAKQLRTELARKHLTSSIEKMTPKSNTLMTSAAQSHKETRQIESLLITPESISLPAPNLQELQDYYDAYRDEFSTPEYRTLRIVFIEPKNFVANKENSYDKMYEISHQLEDLLGAGISLKDACEQLKLSSGKLVTLDRTAHDQTGKEEKSLIKNPLIEEAFALNEKEATSLIDYNNGIMVAEVEKIIPMGYKSFANVKNEVQKLWEREQRKEKMAQQAQQVMESLHQEKGWNGFHPTLKTISLKDTSLQQNLLQSLFKQDVGNKFAQSIPTEKGIFIGVVKKIIPSTQTPTKEEIENAIQDWEKDLVLATQSAYTQNYPIEINQDAIQKTFSVYLNEKD